ncbi:MULTISPECIES: RecX family transcriptional regulator [Thermoanaerobacterium]|uniref:Regulatory protein RecX n=1 Tax=Thermoanaerobacterium butyriciformans TaxID=1702242 RepID=A0ABS4NEM7_9THEO|nr:RecX family transcriptional regulator [Thermoanaerobacterium butyriciformans]MBP2071659.1 regulatory protein [Thermoanaerobacterium butyriciformans]WHE08113.1 RecX family transcriptional regulator [Thermoanaerobacterium thermosaccharolyticum]
MKITNIEKQKNNSMRFNVYIDNKYAFSVSYEEKKEFDLKEGIDIDEEQYNYYVNFLVNKSAYNDSLKFLSYSMRTKKELIDKLKLKGYDDSIINNVLEKLIQQRYIDDEYYTELYIKEKKERLYSKYRIYHELYRKGIDPSIIASKLDQLYEDEIDTIKKLIIKKRISTNDKLKIKNYLFRKGFMIEDINKALLDEEVN